MRVLVTGATGYLGRVLVPRLRAAGHEVVELRRAGAAAAGVRVADLRDAAAVREALGDGPFDGVCHLAAATRARASHDDPLAFYATNVAGTIGLLEAVTAAGARPRVVLASTGAVYAARPEPLDEAAPIAPATPYARTKRAAEDCVADAATAGAIAAVTLRTFNVAGGADGVADRDTTRLIPRALAVAHGDEPAFPLNGDGSAAREFTHVLDVADAYVMALEAVRPGEHRVYNVGSGEGVAVARVLEVVEEVTGRRVPIDRRPPAAEATALVADSRRLTAELGWVPARSSIRRIVADAWTAAGGAAP